MSKLKSLLVLLLISSHIFGQKYSGNYYGGYSGVLGIQENPATFLNNKPKWDINVIGLGASIYTEYGYLSDQSILGLQKISTIYNASDSIPTTYNSTKEALFYTQQHDGAFKGFLFNTTINLPSFCFKVTDWSFGVFGNTKLYASAIDVPNFFDYKNLKILPDSTFFTIPPFSIQAMAWSEIGLHLGKSFDLPNEQQLTFGVNLKYLMGYEAGFAHNIKNFNFQKYNDTSFSSQADIKFGFATGTNLNAKSYNFGVQGTGVGVDIGAEYMIWNEDLTTSSRHKYKFGASITDIGSITFDNNTQVHQYTYNNISDVANNIHKNNTNLDDIFKRVSTAVYGNPTTSLKSNKMTMYLPTALHLNTDINIYQSLYFHANISRRLYFFNPQIPAPNVMSVGARYEQRWLEAGMQFSLVEDKWFGVGSYVRLGVLTIGSDHIMAYFFPQSQLRGADIYLSLKIMPMGNKHKEKSASPEHFGSHANKNQFGCFKF